MIWALLTLLFEGVEATLSAGKEAIAERIER